MKRVIFIISLLFISYVQLNAQARLTVNKETIELGQIEWNKPVTVDYTVTNSGDIPLILADVFTSCACSVASWPSLPIQPGEKGVISVDFDAKALGQFYKEVSIYSNSSPDIVYLNFTGEVVREITDFSNTHPYEIGGIRIDKKTLEFGDVVEGSRPQLKLSVANETDAPYAPILMHIPSFLNVETSDMYLEKGQKGEFTITLNADYLMDYGLFNSELYLSRFIGDKVSKDNKIPFSFTLLPNLENQKDDLTIPIPSLKISQREFSTHSVLRDKNKVSHQIEITNVGRGNLKVLKLQTFSPGVQLKVNKAELKTGEVATIKMTIDKRKFLSDKENLDIILITNDPYQSKITIMNK